MDAKCAAYVLCAFGGGKGGLRRFGRTVHRIGRQKGDFVALCNDLGEAVALVETALQAAFAADGHGKHGIKGLAGEPRRGIFVQQPCEHGGKMTTAVVFPSVQQRGDGGGVFGARPKGGIRRRMALAVAAQGLV